MSPLKVFMKNRSSWFNYKCAIPKGILFPPGGDR